MNQYVVVAKFTSENPESYVCRTVSATDPDDAARTFTRTGISVGQVRRNPSIAVFDIDDFEWHYESGYEHSAVHERLRLAIVCTQGPERRLIHGAADFIGQ